MSRKQKQEEVKPGSPEYMTTYGDMMTLLLCFFVLLFAMSSIDAQKFQAIMQSFHGSAGVLKSGKTIDDDAYIQNSALRNKITNSITETQRLKALKASIEQHVKENKLEKQISVQLEERGLLLRFNENVLFDSGKADLKKGSKEILVYLSNILSSEDFNDRLIVVEGHTDSDPIRNIRKFPTNWELSTTRAVNVLRYLVEETEMNPERFSAGGYSKYHPVVVNDSPENKSKNRRVDIVILRRNGEEDSK